MKMSQKLWVPLLIAALSVIGAFAIVATAPSVEFKEPERAIPTVRTISAQAETHRHRVRTQGTVAPRSEADLVPESSGSHPRSHPEVSSRRESRYCGWNDVISNSP